MALFEKQIKQKKINHNYSRKEIERMINKEENNFVINDRFSDINFRNFIVENVLNRKDGTTDIFESDLETLSQITELTIGRHRQIEDVSGIEQFKSLEKLDISFTNIKELDGSELSNLKELYVVKCGLETVKLPQFNKLEVLNCSHNKLTKLDVKDCSSLKELYCSNNQLIELDLSENKELETFYCNFNRELNKVIAHSYKNLLDSDVYDEVLNVTCIDQDRIKLKDCGKALECLATYALESTEDMLYLDEDDFIEFIENYNLTQEDWNQLDHDIEKFELDKYIDVLVDNLEDGMTQTPDPDSPCVIIYEHFYKNFDPNVTSLNINELLLNDENDLNKNKMSLKDKLAQANQKIKKIDQTKSYNRKSKEISSKEI